MRCLFLFVGLLIGAGASGMSLTEPAAVPTNAAVARPAPPPMPPPTPVDTFRRFLNMTPAEREKILAQKSPEQRQVIRLKLLEYQALSPEERDARLRSLQRRMLVQMLIREPYSNRVERLRTFSEADRQLVEPPLRQWDQLPADLQKDVLENEWAIRIVVRSEPGPPKPEQLTPQQREMENRLARWKALPEDKRQQVLDQFQQFFDELTDQERAKALNALDETERRQMEATLQTFARLPKAQRDLCLTGFKKFADLSFLERQQFLINASLWQNMTAKDRALWRALVGRMNPKPPLPPGMATPPQPPPLPGGRPPLANTDQR